MEDRYSRQVALGWHQDKISKTSVAALGNNSLFLNLFLTFLGYRNIIAAGEESGSPYLEESFLDIDLDGEHDVGKIEHVMKTMNPKSNCLGVLHDLSGSYLEFLVKTANVVVETRQDPSKRESTLAYVKKHNKPAVFISNQGNAVLVHSYYPDHTRLVDKRTKSFFVGAKGGSFLPLLLYGASAFAAGEVLNHTLNLSPPPRDPFVWNLEGADRFWYGRDISFDFDTEDFSNLRILQVGAGGTGVNVAYLAANFLKPNIIYVVDYDSAHITNLNRQFPYYDESNLGRPKVEILAEVLGNKTNMVPIKAEFDEDFSAPGGIDMIIDSSAGFVNQLRVHNYALAHKIPLVKVAAEAYVSDIHKLTAGFPCFNHQYNLRDKALYEALLTIRPGCDHIPEGSNIITTAMGASILVGEIPSIVMPEKYGPSPKSALHYRMNKRERAYVDETGGPCRCKSRKLSTPRSNRIRYVDNPDNTTTIFVNNKPLER